MIFNTLLTKVLRYSPAGTVLLLTAYLFYPDIVQGAEVAKTNVEHNKGRFVVHSSMLIQLPASRVRAILTNFENLPEINKDIKLVKILERRSEDKARMWIKSEVCVLFVCLDYQWVQDVQILSSGDIITRFDPAVSDFREGWVRYQLRSEGDRTRLIMDAKLVPDFWFPPVIGPMIVKSKLRNETLETALGIEEMVYRDPSIAKGRGRRIVFHSESMR